MANDEDAIRISVEAGQAQAALTALATEVGALEAELQKLKATTGVTNAEIEGATNRLAEAKAKYAETADAVRNLNKEQEDSGDKSKSLADKYTTLAVRLFGARQVLMSLGEAMKSVAQATGTYSGATKDAIDEVGNLASSIGSLDLIGASKALGQLAGQTVAWAQGLNEANVQLGAMADKDAAGMFAKILAIQRGLVAGHEEEIAALDRKAQALSREIDVQTKAGNVQKFLKDEILATLEAYAKAGEQAPEKLAAQAAALDIVTKAQQETAASSAELESVAIKSAEARAKAEQKAAEEIVAALAKEQAALAAKLAQDEKDLAAKLDKGSKLDTSVDTSEAESNIKSLKDEIRKLEAEPLDIDGLNRLDDLKNKAADAELALNGLNRTFTVGNQDFLDQAQAADAAASAWNVYADRLKQAQLRQDEAMRSMDDAEASLSDFSETADGAGESLGDVADAAGEIGDETEKGKDKALKALEDLKAGAEEVTPLLETIRGLLTEIKQIASEVDL